MPNIYRKGKLLLYIPKEHRKDTSLPKGYYIVVKNKYPRMLLCPIPETEMLIKDGFYVTYVHSAIRNDQFQSSNIHLKVNDSLIPKINL